MPSRFLAPVAQLDFLTSPLELAPGQSVWWKLPPGERSYTAPAYEGFEESARTTLRSCWTHSEVCQTFWDSLRNHIGDFGGCLRGV